jgi:hypothetical protein
MVTGLADRPCVVFFGRKHNSKISSSNLGSIITTEDAPVMTNIFKNRTMVLFTCHLIPSHYEYFFAKIFLPFNLKIYNFFPK